MLEVITPRGVEINSFQRLRRYAELLIERNDEIAGEFAPAPESGEQLALDPEFQRRSSIESRMAVDPGREGADDRRHEGDLRGQLPRRYPYDSNRIMLLNARPAPTAPPSRGVPISELPLRS